MYYENLNGFVNFVFLSLKVSFYHITNVTIFYIYTNYFIFIFVIYFTSKQQAHLNLFTYLLMIDFKYFTGNYGMTVMQ